MSEYRRRPYIPLTQPVPYELANLRPGFTKTARAETVELNRTRKRLNAKRQAHYEQRVAEGVIGECAHCGINVYLEDGPFPRPSCAAMPCNVPGCPYERACDQDIGLTDDACIPLAYVGESSQYSRHVRMVAKSVAYTWGGTTPALVARCGNHFCDHWGLGHLRVPMSPREMGQESTNCVRAG